MGTPHLWGQLLTRRWEVLALLSTDCVYGCEPWNVWDSLGRLTEPIPVAGVGGGVSGEREGPEQGWTL